MIRKTSGVKRFRDEPVRPGCTVIAEKMECNSLALFGTLQGGKVKLLNFFSCPGRLAQEFQAGLYGRVAGETGDFDIFSQFFPAIIGNEKVHDLFEGYAVERIIRLFVHVLA